MYVVLRPSYMRFFLTKRCRIVFVWEHSSSKHMMTASTTMITSRGVMRQRWPSGPRSRWRWPGLLTESMTGTKFTYCRGQFSEFCCVNKFKVFPFYWNQQFLSRLNIHFACLCMNEFSIHSKIEWPISVCLLMIDAGYDMAFRSVSVFPFSDRICAYRRRDWCVRRSGFSD